jgi:hypothetical protein
METPYAPVPHHSRVRRWLIWLAIVILSLAVYAVALRWFTLRVESGVEASIHPIMIEGQPRAPE